MKVSNHTLIEQRFLIYFIPEVNHYSMHDRIQPMPMRPIENDDIICTTNSLENALIVTDALNEQGLI